MEVMHELDRLLPVAFHMQYWDIEAVFVKPLLVLGVHDVDLLEGEGLTEVTERGREDGVSVRTKLAPVLGEEPEGE